MNAITFDTLQFVQTLEDVGVDRQQATAIAQAVRDSHDAAELATKSDLREFKAEMKVEMRELEMRLRELELRIVIKLGSLMVILMGLMLAILKL